MIDKRWYNTSDPLEVVFIRFDPSEACRRVKWEWQGLS